MNSDENVNAASPAWNTALARVPWRLLGLGRTSILNLLYYISAHEIRACSVNTVDEQPAIGISDNGEHMCGGKPMEISDVLMIPLPAYY